MKQFMHWLAQGVGLASEKADGGGRLGHVGGRDVKGLVSPKLFDIPDVSGLGQQGNTLTVYLKSDSDRTRREVETVVKNVAPSAKIAFRLSGPFRAHAA